MAGERREGRNKRKRKVITDLGGDFGLSKIGAARFDLRDPYHIAVSLSWPAFVVALLLLWLAINLLFAGLYLTDPGGVANARPGSFSDMFFFSVETLATVGYGVMAPTTPYCHVISAAEIVSGTAFTAIVTGLLFVRFSRPKARIIFADAAVVTTHNGLPTLMVRLVNGRVTPMTSANARIFILLSENTHEGLFYRRVVELALAQSHLPLFIMPWTLMHHIDEASPLYGRHATALAQNDTRLFVSIEARDRVLATVVGDLKPYQPEQIRFGMRYCDAVTLDEGGGATADLSRISLIEPDKVTVAEMSH